MSALCDEILEAPRRAEECLEQNRGVELPRNAPCLGMGASHYAALALSGGGAPIVPEVASEYFHYRSQPEKTVPRGVLVSQSGETTETLWNLARFDEVIAITNNPSSTLAKSPNTKRVIELCAGEEMFSATKTYINTLVVLFSGLGIDPTPGIARLQTIGAEYEAGAEEHAAAIADFLSSRAPDPRTPVSATVNGFFVLGDGPNAGTAYEAALALTETTKFPWLGMSVSQFNHGPKEAARDSVVVFLNGGGKAERRIATMREFLGARTNACVIELKENSLDELLTPFPLVFSAYLFMDSLLDMLKIDPAITLGSKITVGS